MHARQLLRRTARGAKRLLHRAATPIDRALRPGDQTLLPPAHLRLYYYGTLDPEPFVRGCDTASIELRSRGLMPTHRVLDIGSGLGNLAVGLLGYLQGEYDGIEIHREATAWCRKAITSSHPSFRFHHADVASVAYNPKGRLSAAAYQFPFADRTFDYILLSSVFTHMLPDAVEHYVREIARVLVPGGRCIESYFLLNDDNRRAVEEGRSFIRFDVHHPSRLCRLHDLHTPEAAVALEEEFVRRVHAATGLQVRDIRRGRWWQGTAHDQDVVTAVRAGSG